jgi:hypothetical protein
LNDYSIQFKYSKNTLLCYNQNVHNLYKFNKESFLKEKLKIINYNKINFIKKYTKIQNKIRRCSIKIKKNINFELKISKCRLDIDYDEIIKKIESYISRHKRISSNFHDFIKDKTINDIFDNYNVLYEYLLNIKIINSFEILLKILKSDDSLKMINFCNQSKIFDEYFLFKYQQFNYKFEALFELISGNELLKEQMNRYIKIINEYNIDETYTVKQIPSVNNDTEIDILQSGGKYYPLHHFMMGKGKSAIITPMLSLYFSLKCNRNVIIVVPAHLEKQTHKTMDEYCHIFNIKDKVKILNDSTIKKYYLSDVFLNDDNSDTIMLIDEFDSILDPMKSNFNVVIEKSLSINNLYNLFIKDNFDAVISNQLSESLIDEDLPGLINDSVFNNVQVDKLIKEEIVSTLIQIKNKKLIENINWGIHPIKGYAIPYRSKGNPLLNSNFSSSVLTVFLTLYYYITIKKYTIDKLIVNYIINNNLFGKLFKTLKEPTIITLDYIIRIINEQEITDEKLFDIIFYDIFNKILLPENRYNTSFVDILNIPNLFKIGYSGTINIDLPKLENDDRFDINYIEKDPDEKDNIEYAILNKNTQSLYYANYIAFINDDDYIDLNNYDALIDTIGLYKDYNNEDIARKIYTKFNNERPIIFIDELDNIYVLINDKIENYKSTTNYIKPFIYYSQAHIVGIDIKQDNYPILKGLCIIDNNSAYSQIAQSMFRLRKLNMGHSIDFLNNDKERTCREILDDINKNELKLNESKKKYLLFQTLKSQVRRKALITKGKHIYDNITELENGSDIKYNQVYYEQVKYYYDNYDTSEKIIFEIIKNFKDVDKNNENYKGIEGEINNLIYNIDSNSQEQEQEREQNKETSLPLQIKYTNQNCEYIDYDFTEIISNIDQLEQNCISINNDIYCLPNFDTQVDTYEFKNNKIGILFVYITEIDKFLIIPGYLIMEFCEYPILDIQFKCINDKIISDKILDKIKSTFLYKILTSEITSKYDFPDENTGIVMISYLIIKLSYHFFNNNITSIQKNFYDYMEQKILNSPSEYIYIYNRITHIKEYNQRLFIETQTIDNFNFKRKYLKYKQKYLKLINYLKPI